ncbi:WD40 repeat domain-containing protein [Streptomyces chryseus]|uniref:WD40 repeat domain-containing protein n=1 Tax=Streptomyces chryseus TaxID=68186 RepID=UPI00142F040A|nr:WD40 repeat domain-containing protein [Streptomyces chryseus]
MVLSLGIPLVRTEDGDSPRPGLDLLEKAPDHALSVVEILKDFDYTRAVVPNPCADYWGLVEQALVAEDVDVLIVHIVGHGQLAEGSSEKLYVLDSRGDPLRLPVGAWIDRIEDHSQRHRPMTLFILDVCYAGEAAVTSWHSRMDVPERRAWVLAATGPRDQAFGYRLSHALVRVLAKYRDLEVRFDPSVRYIPSPTVWREIDRTVGDLTTQDNGLAQKVITSLVPSHADLSHLRFFPNPSYNPGSGPFTGLPSEIARLADWAADPEHFMRRAGGAEPVHRSWDKGYFSGREMELGELSPWLDDSTAAPGLRVVTGKPGAGKSALLGVLVCAAHPRLREHTELLWRGLDDLAPGKNDRIAVVHARRLGLDQIVGSLACQLRHIGGSAGRSEPDSEDTGSTSNPVDHLLSLLPDDGPPVTVIIDALDEAVRPEDITATFLLPLAQQARAPRNRLRLLVGTRDDLRSRSLLAFARDQGACTDLSAAEPESVCRSVTTYVKRLLTTDGCPYADGARRAARDALAQAIAERLTGQGRHDGSAEAEETLQWGEFLTAGLYVHYLLATEEPRDAPQEAAALGRAVPRSLPALLELDLQRHTGQPLLRPVLTALAFAQGRGMPESVLAHAAAAFTTTGDSRPLPHKKLHALLDGEARFYLRRDVDEDGKTLYRFFHEGLAEWLRDNARIWPLREVGDTDVTGSIPLRPAGQLYERLMDCVPRDGSGRKQWQWAGPYLLRHTAQHAVDAGFLDDLIQDSGFLVYADPHAMADALARARSEQARLNAAVYRASWGVHHALSPEARRQLLALDAARFRNEELQADLPGDADWNVRWATGSQVSPELVRTLTGHTGEVGGVAVARLEGRPHAITGSPDGSVRVWDLTTGIQTRELTGHTGWVGGVAVAQLEGRPHAITGSTDRSVRVWDLTTGIQTRELTGHTGGVTGVAVAQLEGRPHAITGSTDDGSVRVWDLITGIQTRELTGHTGWVGGVAVAQLEGRPHAITGGDDGSVRVWDLTTGIQTGKRTGHTGWVTAVAVAQLEGRPHALTGGNDNSVQVWDLTTGIQTRELTGHTGGVHGVAVAHLEGRPYAITGSIDGSVRVWDLITGIQTRELTGHTGGVHGVAVAHLEGRPHAITGGADGSVRVWDLTTGTGKRTGHIGWVTAVAVAHLEGRPYAITGSTDGSVRVWDLTTGIQTRELTGHTGWVTAVAVAQLEGRPHAITGSTADGSVRVWDLTTGIQTRTLTGRTGWVTAVAVAQLEGRPHAITGSDDGSVRVWDLTTGIQTGKRTGRTGWVTAVALAELEGRPYAITGSDDGSVRVWDLTTGIQTRELTGHTGGVHGVAVAQLEGRPHAITGSKDRSVRVWDLTTGSCRTMFHLPDAGSAAAVALDGTVVLGVGHEVVALSLTPLAGRLH